MWHLDEGLVHSWLDGAASDAEARSVEAHLAGCESCRAMVAEARGLVAGASLIIGALDNMPGDVIPAQESVAVSGAPARQAVAGQRRIRKASFWSSPLFRMAAGLVLVAGVSTLVVRDKFPVAKGKAQAVADQVIDSLSASRDLSSALKTPAGGVIPSAATGAVPGQGALGGAAAASRPSGRVESDVAPPALDRSKLAESLEKSDALLRLAAVGDRRVSGGAASADSTAGKGALTVAGGALSDSAVRAAYELRQAAMQKALTPVPIPAVSQLSNQQALLALAGKTQGLVIRDGRDPLAATRVGKLPPVLSTELLRGENTEIATLERESSGCYVVTALSADGNVRRIELASSLTGMLELNEEPIADSVSDVLVGAQAQQAQQVQGQAQQGRVQGGAAGAGAGAGGTAGAGRGGGGGARAAGAAGGGGGGGAGRGGIAAESVTPAAPPSLVRSLGWRAFTRDSIEVRIAIDTTFIELRLQRLTDSTLMGVARVTADSAVGVVGTVMAQKAACQ